MKRIIEDSLSLIAGAGVGMAAMYLLDPRSGERRRQAIAESARHGFEGASEALRHAADSARHAVSSSSSRLSDLPHSASRHARKAFSRMSDRSSELSEAASESAGDLAGRASESLRSLGDYAGSIGSAVAGSARHFMPSSRHLISRSRQWIPERFRSEHPTHEREGFGPGSIAGITAGGIGLIALGAGLAFLFDPDRGRSRRAYIRDQFIGLSNDTGQFMRKMGRHLSNKSYGTLAQTRAKFRGERPTDHQLEERVRSALGRVEGGSSVDVLASDGHVTLRLQRSAQPVPNESLNEIYNAARSVRGVRTVECEITPATQTG